MTNKDFLLNCLEREKMATINVIKSLPEGTKEYRPEKNSRNAYELVEHIVAHTYDFEIILTEDKCDECLELPFASFDEAADKLESFWDNTIKMLGETSEEVFNQQMVELMVKGKALMSMPRRDLLWFFLFDIIHHRGQLTTYIRPMGGKNPAVYGYSFDTLSEMTM